MSARRRNQNPHYENGGGGIPHGICRNFWISGACRFGQACKYEHRSPQNEGLVVRATNPATQVAFAAPVNFGQATVALNRICSAEGAIKTTGQAVILVNIVAQVASSDSGWSNEDRETVVDKLTTGDGLLRLQQIINWDDVSASGTPSRTAIPFQAGYAHILSFLTCNTVVKSTLRIRANKLYSLIDRGYESFERIVITCMDTMASSNSTRNEQDSSTRDMSFGAILEILVTLLREYLDKFRTTILEDHPAICKMPEHLAGWLDWWSRSNLTSPTVEDGKHARLAARLRREIENLSVILNRKTSQSAQIELGSQTVTIEEQESVLQPSETQLSIIHRVYEPPGELRLAGSRHDNDHADIASIFIAPTQQELQSKLPSFVPSTVFNAPHHLPMHTMERLLDIQFRLLREEFMYPIRASTNLVISDLKKTRNQTSALQPIISARGGRYKGNMDNDAVFFSVYTNVEIGEISADRRGTSVKLSFDTPPGKGRNKKPTDRETHWKTTGKRRLNTGAFVALVWNKTELHLGLVTSRTDDLIAVARESDSRLSIRVQLFGSAIEHRAIERMTRGTPERGRPTPKAPLTAHLLLEIDVLYEAARPFLEALKVEPTGMPFSKYLKQAEEGALSRVSIDPPEYTMEDGFEWNLSSLFNPPVHNVRLKTGDEYSKDLATHQLKNRASTRVDPSQADAIISCLTREVAMIQGPPGTGKSYTAIQLLRVLIANGITNIVMVAFTNHALDHLLESVLKEHLTTKIVRIGSRSQSEELQPYVLDKLVKFQNSYFRRGVSAAFAGMKAAEQAFGDGMKKMAVPGESSSTDLLFHLQLNYPDHYQTLTFPPSEIRVRAEELLGINHDDEWELYQFWEQGRDQQGGGGRRARDIRTLLQDTRIWAMPPAERKVLSRQWKAGTMENLLEGRLSSFANLKKTHEAALQQLGDVTQAEQLEILRNSDIIGCTTTGAAKILGLLKTLQPKVILVEEAGQVLEAHSLATLVPSVQHLIMIGDPQQLRPNISTYAFATENPQGGQLFKFDRSLMERLSSSGLPMSQLTIQRRMRPAVSNIIRRCLYPHLQDHESVKTYPPVRGMAKDIWFFHHTNKNGGGGEDGVSKCNMFEVEMVKALALFFLRQGVYNNTNSIVILCTYMGQLTKIREALSSCKVSVVLDERDEKILEQQGILEDDDKEVLTATEPLRVDVSKQIKIRTVDNFQGEEADIIILSLVRNPGQSSTGGIGFLKSSNRTNVALSRARHGMFVLGHGEVLQRGGGIWSTIIDEFKKQDAYGPAFPFACYRHPNDVEWLSDPNLISTLYPNGRCLRECGAKLDCGHSCPSLCHPDDQYHSLVKCTEHCGKLCPLGHPCEQMCGLKCRCDFLVADLRLPCGHVEKDVTCNAARNPRLIVCKKIVRYKFATCEHTIDVPCHVDPSRYKCDAICGKEMDCCSKRCKATCRECCQYHPRRKLHQPHPCDKVLHCQHSCKENCKQGHQCVCTAPCRQVCGHSRCTTGCARSCTPCAEKCTWACRHHSCPASCGSPCTRLPCDLRCESTLECGHRCSSLCGEPCDAQTCLECATEDQKGQVVDMILQSTLADIDPQSPDLDNILITLPCKRAFTVETLDGICELGKYYEQEDSRWIRPILPPPGTVQSPVCPQCRGEIVSPRYGRVLKRCNLDLLERTIAAETAQEVQAILQAETTLDLALIESRILKINIFTSGASLGATQLLIITKAYQDKLALHHQLDNQRVFSTAAFFGRALKDYGLTDPEMSALREATNDISAPYQRAYHISLKSSSHRKAYENALTRIYRQELERLSGGSSDVRARQQQALAIAKDIIGMPPPLADQRFQVEAIWITVELRLKMAKMLGTLHEKIAKEERSRRSIVSTMLRLVGSNQETKGQSELLKQYILFIYSSAEIDATLARETAGSSGAARQVLKSELKLLRIDLALFEFQVRLLDGESTSVTIEKRQVLGRQARSKSKQAVDEINRARDTYFRHRECTRVELDWIKDAFIVTTDEIVHQWDELSKSLLTGTFYQPLTIEERRQIHQAFNFSHRGHWYVCPNGHTFVIGECGGAMEVGRCNECGALVGGGDHRLLGNNTRDTQFESIAREQGAAQSPWQWAADA